MNHSDNSQSRSYFTPRFDEIIRDLENLIGRQQYYSYAPVLQHQIDQNIGIEIRGEFKTNDSTIEGEMCYVTVGRNNAVAIPHDGFGLAWRKTVQRDSELHPYDYNVYLVDSDALHEEVYVLNEMITQNSGINNFIVAGKCDIVVDTWYKFKIRIQQNYAMRIWIVSSDNFEWDNLVNSPYDAVTQPAGYCLDRGAQSLDTLSSDYVPIAQGTCFGIGVGESKNSEWWYKDILITNITETYPEVLFKLEAPSIYFPDNAKAHFYWKGYGRVGTENYDYGASLYIWNNRTSTWELMGTNDATEESEPSEKEIEYTLTSGLDDYLYDETDGKYFNVLARTNSADNKAVLRTHYVRVDNHYPEGIHLGNMMDIYVNAPTKILRTTLSTGSALMTLPMTTENGFILPIQEIIEVKSLDEPLIRNAVDGYYIDPGFIGNAWSVRANQTLVLPSAMSVDVTYTYFSDGANMQALIDDDSVRNAGNDNLIKLMPPAVIVIESLYYRDGPGEGDLKIKIANWINNLGSNVTFEISDLVAYLYSLGVTFINLDSLVISVRRYNPVGSLVDTNEITSTYTIGKLNAFYSDSYNLYGVTRL